MRAGNSLICRYVSTGCLVGGTASRPVGLGTEMTVRAEQLTKEELNLFTRKMARVIDGLQYCNSRELWLDSPIRIEDKI